MIRRCRHGEHARVGRHRGGQRAGLTTLRAAGDALITAKESGKTVSYTHLTLPTKRIV